MINIVEYIVKVFLHRNAQVAFVEPNMKQS